MIRGKLGAILTLGWQLEDPLIGFPIGNHLEEVINQSDSDKPRIVVTLQ